MWGMGLRGAIRGKPLRSTISEVAPCPLDDVTDSSTLLRLTVCGWPILRMSRPRPASSMSPSSLTPTRGGSSLESQQDSACELRPGALEQALHDRRPASRGGLVHHSDRGVQCLSIKYTEHLAEAGIRTLRRNVDDSCDNALAETINGLYTVAATAARYPEEMLPLALPLRTCFNASAYKERS